MTCEQIERDEVAEQYLSGRLSVAEQDAFEAHYFDCARCQERLQVLEDTRRQLSRATGTDVPGPSVFPAVTATRPPRFRWRVAGAALAAAAVIIVAVRLPDVPDSQTPTVQDALPTRGGDVKLEVPQSAPTAPDARALAEIQPPRYEAPRLRASPTAAQREFRAAMERYAAADCAGAIAGLRRALALDQALIAANFYLAVCVLQGTETADGVRSLQRVIAAGESPYLEDAHFFLAKARIREGDISGARIEIARVIALDGDRRDEARQLLAQLSRLR